MNRQGEPGVHPGAGWKDPGQLQGSSKNTADPDCTGNRSIRPQPTNKGACDDPLGAADKPGGTGGFDADKDFNNGCGNDTDFEDDNNGRCGGERLLGQPPGRPPSRRPPPGRQPVLRPEIVSVLRHQVAVAGVKLVAAPLAPAKLPETGPDVFQMLLIGTGLMAMGQGLVRRGRGR